MSRQMVRGKRPFTPSALIPPLACLSVIAAGCAGKPFNIKTRVDLPEASFSARARPSVPVGDLELKATPVTDEDLLYTTFDANLIMAGVLPVSLMITNGGQATVDLRKAQYQLMGVGGHRYRALDRVHAFKRLVSYYEIRTYSKHGYKQSRDDFASYTLDSATPLGQGQSRAGLIFFEVPPDVARAAGLTLTFRGLWAGASRASGAAELKLD